MDCFVVTIFRFVTNGPNSFQEEEIGTIELRFMSLFFSLVTAY